MKLAVSLPLVESIKDELRQSLPEVKSSHRVEALARGLGWSANAALRAMLADGPSERDVVPPAFKTYLAERGFRVDDRALPDAILRAQIRAVMAAHEELTHHGFGVHQGDRIPVAEWRTRYASRRAEMLGGAALAEFERACEFLARLETTRAPTTVFSSYNLKHSAERWHKHRGIEGRWDREYVSNGMLLAAAFHLGLQVRRVSRTAFTGHLNVSTASVRALEEERKPPLPQPEASEPFRVLGVLRATGGAGRYSYLPAGSGKPITLGADEHTPKNLLRLAPLEYWVAKFPPRNRRAPFDALAALSELVGSAAKVGIFEPDDYRRLR